ncbi:glycoside hydrolase [Ceraceosorus guamensis]|uniref:beta-N-acetylhexosaminidase n=1 Tax=Ceraceosorus guamensis TaxID=1522189 RepID=A0A316WBA4_9BASI|nr:glycoside hydrolase [Ceraceosorus guamensis]PWN46238.1 glycoside hydrolase [Ceraceosorus guamensis]
MSAAATSVDVLSATPALPSLDGDVQTSHSVHIPTISLHIPIENVPTDLLAGLREIASNTPRQNIHIAQHRDQGFVPVSGKIETSSRTTRGGATWWWNVAFQHDSTLPSGGLKVNCSNDGTFLRSTSSGAPDLESSFVVLISYTRLSEAFRGLGHVLGVTRDLIVPAQHLLQRRGAGSIPTGLFDATSQQWALDPELAVQKLSLQESATFETVGTMIDCSRNGVLRVVSIKFMLRSLALMGYNMLQLYTEDTYKIEGEPFFGYLRGGYTHEELKEVDDYAFALGIEVIPCIQTLGHLGQMLQWPKYLALRDTTEVLLAEWPETYVMLEKMLHAATAPFRSKRVHLGMDETHGLAHGRYHQIFGQHNYKEPTRVFVEHLQKVNALALGLGLKPMIWSDMLFCLSARNNSLLGYYDSAQPTSVDGIPPNVDLVYWDYYHTSKKSYSDRIDSHKLLARKSPWMAAGIWTWTRHWTALPFSFATCKANLNASKAPNSGVKHVMVTCWGDEGNEQDPLSALPAWHYYAEHCYEKTEEVDLPRMRARFDGIVGASFNDYVMASRLDDMNPEEQSIDDRIHFAPNTSKWLLWEEPALGFISPSVEASGIDLETHYTELDAYLSARLSTQASTAPDETSAPARSIADHPLNARLRLPQLLASALSLKAALRLRLHKAYVARDWKELYALAGPEPVSRMSRLRAAVQRLHKYHCTMWHSTYKPFGWETLDLRYGGLVARLETMHSRLVAFLSHIQAGGEPGKALSQSQPTGPNAGVLLNAQGGQDASYDAPVDSLPELQVPLHVVYASALQLLDYHRVSRPTYC